LLFSGIAQLKHTSGISRCVVAMRGVETREHVGFLL
jgi:hypothetical protein